jgi:hypothetical protein
MKLPTIARLIHMRGGLAMLEEKRIRIGPPSDGYMRLVIERIGIGPRSAPMISVAHYYEQNGDAMRDPEMTFEVGPGRDILGADFFAVSFQQDNLGVYREAVKQGDKPGQVLTCKAWVKDMESFARVWDRNIKAQGFVEAFARQEAKAAEHAPNSANAIVSAAVGTELQRQLLAKCLDDARSQNPGREHWFCWLKDASGIAIIEPGASHGIIVYSATLLGADALGGVAYCLKDGKGPEVPASEICPPPPVAIKAAEKARGPFDDPTKCEKITKKALLGRLRAGMQLTLIHTDFGGPCNLHRTLISATTCQLLLRQDDKPGDERPTYVAFVAGDEFFAFGNGFTIKNNIRNKGGLGASYVYGHVDRWPPAIVKAINGPNADEGGA